MSNGWAGEQAARAALVKLGIRPASIDPAILLLLAEVIVESIKMINDCRNRPTPNDVRTICRKPTGVQRTLIAGHARHRLSAATYRKLGGRRLIDAGLQAILDCSDDDIRCMLSI